MKSPKYEEDPEEVAARERERRLSEIELTGSTEQAAAGLTSDLRATYGLKSGGRNTVGSTVAPEVAAPQLPTFAQFLKSRMTNEPDKNTQFNLTRGSRPGVDYRLK